MVPDLELIHKKRAAVRRLIKRTCVAVVCTAVALWGGLLIGLYVAHYATDYPNGRTHSTQTILEYRRNLVVRRDAVYKSTDSYSTVNRWYYTTFRLPNPKSGAGTCEQLQETKVLLFRVVQDLTVMVCDDTTERTVYVARAWTWRYPAWVRQLGW